MSTVEELDAEIHKICDSLVEEANAISLLDPVSHLSNTRRYWIQFGGIFEIIRRNREDKRMYKLMNVTICKEWTFYSYVFHLIEIAQDLTQKQTEIQKAISEKDPRYFDNVRLIVSSISTAHDAWFEHSPTLAVEKLSNKTSLEQHFRESTKNEFCKLRSPDDMTFTSDEDQDGCGCYLVALILFIIGGIWVAIP